MDATGQQGPQGQGQTDGKRKMRPTDILIVAAGVILIALAFWFMYYLRMREIEANRELMREMSRQNSSTPIGSVVVQPGGMTEGGSAAYQEIESTYEVSPNTGNADRVQMHRKSDSEVQVYEPGEVARLRPGTIATPPTAPAATAGRTLPSISEN